MSCETARPTFRLLDRRVGWGDDAGPPDSPEGLIGWDESDPIDGLRLLPPGGTSGSVADAGAILGALPPRRLALACLAGSWLLLTPDGRVLRRDSCVPDWRFVARIAGLSGDHPAVGAIAASTRRFAVVLAESFQLWTIAGEKLLVEIPVEAPTRAAFFPGGDLLVSSEPEGGPVLLRFGPSGGPKGVIVPRVAGPKGSEPARLAGPINRIGIDGNDQIWIVTGADDETLALWKGGEAGLFAPATTDDLGQAFPVTGLTASDETLGFCFDEDIPGGTTVSSCWSWYGKPASDVPPPAKPKRLTSGQFEAVGIDSGIKRCRWHRVRIDADLPAGAGLTVEVATSETPGIGIGQRLPEDIQTAPAGARDFLIEQPPGRYLSVRVTLTGDGSSSPLIRQIRLDFPRRTGLDRLPAVYREDPDAEDFTERFLANFDASVDDFDAAVERFPALLSVGGAGTSPNGPTVGAPGPVLPWLGGFLDVVFDNDWTDDRRRAVLQALPALFPMRGTPDGLRKVIKLVFDLDANIQEWPALRAWGALADSRRPCPADGTRPNARVGAVRVFGRARSRFFLGQSSLGQAPIRGYGDPDLDPLAAEAYRFEVQVPRGPTLDVGRLAALVEKQKPAHTVSSVRVGGEAFVVGVWSTVGVDTSFLGPPAPVLGGAGGNIRLRRASLVAAGPPSGRLGLVVGRSSSIGVHTLME